MCGVPYHSCESYIARLVSRGYKVAICEQVEDPKTAKGIVKRDIVRVITPGTVTDSSMLDEQKNNYIGAYFNREGKIGLCFADISTGAVYATSLAGPAAVQHACSDLGRFAPRRNPRGNRRWNRCGRSLAPRQTVMRVWTPGGR